MGWLHLILRGPAWLKLGAAGLLALFTLFMQDFNGGREAEFAALAQRPLPAPVAIGAYDGARQGTAVEANLRVLVSPALEVRLAVPRTDGGAPMVYYGIGLADPAQPKLPVGAIQMVGAERARFLAWVAKHGERVENGTLVTLAGLIDPPAVYRITDFQMAFLNRMRPLQPRAIWLAPYLGDRAQILAAKADGRGGAQVYAVFWAVVAGLVLLAMMQNKSTTRRKTSEAAVAQAVEARVLSMKLAGMTATQAERQQFAQEERLRLLAGKG